MQKHPYPVLHVKRMLMPPRRIRFLPVTLLTSGLCADNVPYGLADTVLSIQRIIEVASDELQLSCPCNAGEQVGENGVPTLDCFFPILIQVCRAVASS